MKSIQLLLLILITSFTTYAQEETYALDGIKKVWLEADFADIEIVTYKEKVVKIQSTINIDDGRMNDQLMLREKRNGQTLEISSWIKNVKSIPKRKTVYDKKGNIVEISDVQNGNQRWYNSNHDGKSGRIIIEDKVEVMHKIFVPENIQLIIEATYGSLKYDGIVNSELELESTYGSVDAKIQSVSAPIELHSGYSCVDVSIPAAAKCDVLMKSQYGSYFTDLEMDIEPGHNSQNIVATYNGGGEEISMISPYNNIYLRKK